MGRAWAWSLTVKRWSASASASAPTALVHNREPHKHLDSGLRLRPGGKVHLDGEVAAGTLTPQWQATLLEQMQLLRFLRQDVGDGRLDATRSGGIENGPEQHGPNP